MLGTSRRLDSSVLYTFMLRKFFLVVCFHKIASVTFAQYNSDKVEFARWAAGKVS